VDSVCARTGGGGQRSWQPPPNWRPGVGGNRHDRHPDGASTERRNGILRLAADETEESIPISSIRQVQRKQNGIVLGMLIGAGVGFALGLPIAAIGANEGTEVASPLLFMAGVGAAVGTGIDALVWRKRTVYTSWQSGLVMRPSVGTDRVGVIGSKAF